MARVMIAAKSVADMTEDDRRRELNDLRLREELWKTLFALFPCKDGNVPAVRSTLERWVRLDQFIDLSRRKKEQTLFCRLRGALDAFQKRPLGVGGVPAMQRSEFDETIVNLAQNWMCLTSNLPGEDFTENERSWAREPTKAAVNWYWEKPTNPPRLQAARDARAAREEALRTLLDDHSSDDEPESTTASTAKRPGAQTGSRRVPGPSLTRSQRPRQSRRQALR